MTTDSGKKPREFWILPQKGNDCDWTNLYPDGSWKSGSKPLIHVREVLPESPCPNCERLEGKYQEKNDDFRATFLKCLKQQEEIQRLQKQLEMCISALRSIAAKDYPDQIHETYWLEKSHTQCTEVLANDTQIARECLAKLDGAE